jgi:hypothetical protein
MRAPQPRRCAEGIVSRRRIGRLSPHPASSGSVDESADPGWTPTLYWMLLAAVAAITIAPLFIVKYLPLVDLPNHEARIAILAHYSSNPTMRKFYVVDWRPIPDLAFDLFAVPLVRLGLTPIDTGRAFLSIAALLYVIGGHLLAKSAVGKRSWLGVCLPLLFYNSMLFYGFINYVFGFGVFLVAYALWLRWRSEMTSRRVVLLSGLLVIAYLCHLAAFGLLSVAVVVTVVVDRALGRTTRAASSRSILAFIPSLVLLVYGAAARGGSGGMAWGSLNEKIHVLGGMFLTYNYRLDAALLGGVIAVALAAAAFSRKLEVEPSFAVLTVVCALLFIALPHSLITATNVDARVVPAALAFFLLAIRLSPRPRVAAGSRVAVITAQWLDTSGKIATQVRLLDAALPRDSNVYSIFPEGGSQVGKRERAYTHLASYATIYRNTHVSRTFAERSQQPLVSRVDEVAAIDAVPLFSVNFETFKRYSYVWTYKLGPVVKRQLKGRCETIYDTNGFYLCRRRT